MRYLRFLFVTAMIIGGCQGDTTPPPAPDSTQVARPEGTVQLLAVARSALQCLDGTITFAVEEFGGGTIDQNGIYLAPTCGPYVPGTYHILVTGCGETARIPVEVQEAVLSVAVCGVVQGESCCRSVVVIGSGGVVSFYATTTWECPGHVTYSPAPPPAACP